MSTGGRGLEFAIPDAPNEARDSEARIPQKGQLAVWRGRGCGGIIPTPPSNGAAVFLCWESLVAILGTGGH